MMELIEKSNLMAKLGHYFLENNANLQDCIHDAFIKNAWFTEAFTKNALYQIATNFLDKDLLNNWIDTYPLLKTDKLQQKTIGIVMAGNIPLVGFHDFLCVFITGHKAKIKLSSKDTVLWTHIYNTLLNWDARITDYLSFEPILKNCDAYIATGSNNTSTFFKEYFAKYPHIIRQNRTSIAILDNNMTEADYNALENDIALYFGMGCRNVSKIYVPANFNFEKMLEQFKKYTYFQDHNKMRNNYEFQLAMYILNKVPYMSNGSFLFVENKLPFAPISVVNYEYYNNINDIIESLNPSEIQCIVTNTHTKESIAAKTTIPVFEFGKAQIPSLKDYPDGIDVMAFLSTLS